jgi:hypothetical protein
MLYPQARLRVSLCMLAVVCALAGTACKSEKSEGATSAEEAVGSAEPGHGDPSGKRELPASAFDACQGKALGDACTAQFGDKQIQAKCTSTSDSRLACRPDRPDHKKPQGS